MSKFHLHVLSLAEKRCVHEICILIQPGQTWASKSIALNLRIFKAQILKRLSGGRGADLGRDWLDFLSIARMREREGERGRYIFLWTRLFSWRPVLLIYAFMAECFSPFFLKSPGRPTLLHLPDVTVWPNFSRFFLGSPSVMANLNGFPSSALISWYFCRF